MLIIGLRIHMKFFKVPRHLSALSYTTIVASTRCYFCRDEFSEAMRGYLEKYKIHHNFSTVCKYSFDCNWASPNIKRSVHTTYKRIFREAKKFWSDDAY